MPNKFKEAYSFELRCEESTKILLKYPDKIPIIVTKYERCNNVKDIGKNKLDNEETIDDSDASAGTS